MISLIVLFREDTCSNASREVVPSREDGAGDCSHRIEGEMSGGQRGRKAGVLHTYLDGDSRAFSFAHS